MNAVLEALRLLPGRHPSLKVCRMPPYHLDCSDIGRTRVYGNGWSFVIPREVGSGAIHIANHDWERAACYNHRCDILSNTKRIEAGEALTAQLLAIYADWQPERSMKINRALVVQVLAQELKAAA